MLITRKIISSLFLRYITLHILLLSSSVSFSANTAYCDYYKITTQQQLIRNQQLNCYFSGLRWADDIKGHHAGCREINISLAKSELQTRDKALQDCQSPHFALVTPEQGASLDDFIPNEWELITRETYQLMKENNTLAASHIMDTVIEQDFNSDGRPDIIAIIGKRTANQAIFHRFALLILQATEQGYKRLYQLEKGLTDVHPSGHLAVSSRITIFSYEPNELIIHYWSWFDNHHRYIANEYKFTYINNEFVLSGYSYETVYTNTNTSASYTQRTDYDLIKQQKITYDDTNTDIQSCWKETSHCPEPIKQITRIDPLSIGKVTIDSFNTFKPVNFEKQFAIKLLK